MKRVAAQPIPGWVISLTQGITVSVLRRRNLIVLFALLSLGLLAACDSASDSDDGYRPPQTTLRAIELGRAGQFEEAYELFMVAAEQGDRFAQFAVADMYRQGEGVAQDMHRAYEWDKKAAEQGQPHAQHSLGMAYREGEVVEQDLEAGVYWARKAADAGSARALNSLGLIYEDGVTVEPDPSKALRYFRESAEQGEMNGLTNLTRLTAQHDARTTTTLDRYKWFYVYEALSGSEVARENLESLQEVMGWWDVQRAERRARRWLGRYGNQFE